jgi:hypothetical protein
MVRNPWRVAWVCTAALGLSLSFVGCDLLHKLTGPSGAAIQSFNASPSTILPGNPTLLSWEVAGADNVQIDNGIGTVEAKGSRSVSPQWTTTYVLSAHSGTLATRSSVIVHVLPPLNLPVIPPSGPIPTPAPSPTPVPSPTPGPSPSPTPPVAGPVAKAHVGVMFVVCDNQGLPNSQDATNVQVGCKVHMELGLKDAQNRQTDAIGPINWHFSNLSLVNVVPDSESPILKVLNPGDLTVWVTTDGVRSNDYNLHFYR